MEQFQNDKTTCKPEIQLNQDPTKEQQYSSTPSKHIIQLFRMNFNNYIEAISYSKFKRSLTTKKEIVPNYEE